MFRLATFNVNGIRAAERRGFGDWLAARSPDVLAVQEMRCPEPDLPEVFRGYHLTYHCGTLAGRNGVALATRVAPTRGRSATGSHNCSRPTRTPMTPTKPSPISWGRPNTAGR